MLRTRAILTLLAILSCGVVYAQTIPAPQAGPLILKASTTLTEDVHLPGNGVYICGQNKTLDLNGHTIYFGSNGQKNARGVTLYIDWHNTEIPSIPGMGYPTNCVIKNGRIVHLGKGATSAGLYGYRASNCRLENVEILVNGEESAAVSFGYEASTLVGNLLQTTASGKADRHAGPACVKASGAVAATGNVLVGGNSGFNVGSGSKLDGNVIANDSYVTNGYAVWLYRMKGVTVTNNLMLPIKGRGVLLNAGDGHSVAGNVILHRDEPNAEYSDALNATAFRSRYEVMNCVYEGNTSLGIGGGRYCGASGLYLTNDPGLNNRFSGNRATVLLTGTPSANIYAQAVSLEGQGPDSPDEINGNTFRSNHRFICTEGYDGYGSQSAPLVGNHFELVTVPAAVEEFIAAAEAKLTSLKLNSRCQPAARRIIDERAKDLRSLPSPTVKPIFWYAKHWHYDEPAHITRATLQDSVFGPGVDPRTWDTSGAKTAGALDLRVREGDRDLFAITKEAAADAPIVLTEFGPPPVLKRLKIVSGDLRVGGEIVVKELQ